jgi:hypothetical protein
MTLFSQALSAMPHQDDFEPGPTAEAKQRDLETADLEAKQSDLAKQSDGRRPRRNSRLRQIQDGLDSSQEHRSRGLQIQVAPRPAELGQCSDSAGRGSTTKTLSGINWCSKSDTQLLRAI